MSPQKNTYLFKNKTPNHYRKLKFFRCFFSNYSNCHRLYGDLVDNEKAELDFISQFLPAQMSEEEIQKLVDKVINELNATNPSDMGKVMGKLMPQIKGKADGKLVNSIVSSKLK